MMCLWITSCEKLGTANFGTIPTADSGTSYSSISFSGIDSITIQTSTRIKIDWAHVDGAGAYYIFDTTSGTPVYLDGVWAPTATYTATGLMKETTYKFRVNLVDKNGKIDSNTNDVSITTGTFSCPTDFGDYIVVPHNDDYGINSDFCVAKYEMKCAADTTGAACSGNPISQAANKPWVNVAHSGAANRAKELCEALGTGYHLITNNEWMTVARNIETNTVYQSYNWSSGTVGDGYIFYGHNDNSPASALVASSNDSEKCYGTVIAGTNPDCEETGAQQRNYTLSNGEVIWDIAGNTWEFVDWEVEYTTLRNDKAVPPNGLANAFREYYVNPTFTTPTVSMPSISFEPTNNTLTSVNGIGKYYPAPHGSGGIPLRGGYWGSSSAAGIFALGLYLSPTGADHGRSFRCAYSE